MIVVLFLIILSQKKAVLEETHFEGPMVEYLMKEDRRGSYVVKERIEKAPDYQHVCNLTRTVVEVTFPEMEEDVFMNLLGYRGSNMIQLNRCKARSSIFSRYKIMIKRDPRLRPETGHLTRQVLL